MPFRIEFRALGNASPETLRIHVEASEGVPMVETQSAHGRPLAICGGGHSTAEHLDELRSWDGDIWAINGTAAWLAERGVKSVLVTVDPIEMPDSFFAGVDGAIVASSAHPSIYGKVPCRRFHMHESGKSGGIAGGTTTATRLPLVALSMGYTEIHYFGCEGSYDQTTHIDRNEDLQDKLIVMAGGERYVTSPPMLMQCEELSRLFAEFPMVMIDRCGGLVTAMRENADTWEIVAVSAALKDHLEEVNGKQGLYEKEYA